MGVLYVEEERGGHPKRVVPTEQLRAPRALRFQGLGFSGSRPANGFRGAFIRWFGRSAWADSSQSAFLRASRNHAWARPAATRNSPNDWAIW